MRLREAKLKMIWGKDNLKLDGIQGTAEVPITDLAEIRLIKERDAMKKRYNMAKKKATRAIIYPLLIETDRKIEEYRKNRGSK